MRVIILALACLLVGSTAAATVLADEPAAAQASKKTSNKLADVEESFRRDAATASTAADRSAAVKRRLNRLRALVREIEAVDPQAMTTDDHAAAAQIYQRLGLPDEGVAHAEAAVAADPDNEAAHALLVQLLIANKQLNEADKSFSDSLAKFTDSDGIRSLHLMLANAHAAADDSGKAADHLLAFIESQRDGILGAPATSRGVYLQQVAQYGALLKRADRHAEFPDRLDHELAQVRRLAQDRPDQGLGAIAAELIAAKVRYLHETGDTASAQRLLDAEFAKANEHLKSHPDDSHAAIEIFPLWAARCELTQDEVDFQSALDGFMAFLKEQAGRHAGDAELLAACVQQPGALILRLSQVDRSAESAEAAAAVKQLVEAIEPASDEAEAALLQAKTHLSGVLRQLHAQMSHADLIGRDAVLLKPDAWVNGTPLTNEELKGKVVLLDFWAVWCGPCIATFPHLREWQEKYADKGLVMIGVTNYYKYGWNANAGRSEQVEGITPEQEREALVEFAKHHQLHHRFAVMPPGSDFAQQYGVNGIPQVVVIDRRGKIRLIRVGSGQENARAVEAILERLLNDGEPEGG